MKLKSSSILDSPDRKGYTRLRGEVEYDAPGLRAETYWFEVPDRYRAYLSETGNPWLVCLSPLAMVLGEPLKISVPVDPVLLTGIYQRMRVWKLWYPRLSMVPIEAELLDRPVENIGKTCSFFSGGVDAYFTALYYDRTTEPYARIPIDELVNVWGFDIPLAREEAHAQIAGLLRRSSEEMGKEFIDMASNLREPGTRKPTRKSDSTISST